MAHALVRNLSISSFAFAATACNHHVDDETNWTGVASAGSHDDDGSSGSSGGDDDGASGAGSVDDDGGADTSGPGSSADDGGSSASDSTGASDSGGLPTGPSCDAGPDPNDGPCGCGFPDYACDTSNFVDPEGTEGPMPPLCGGGVGLGNGAPTECFGGNFGTYSDVDSFCNYVVGRFTYLENECGNFGTATLAIDPNLGAIAQAEAEAVAGGQCPQGQITCGGTPCGPLDGPTYNLGQGANWMYIDGVENGNLTFDAMYTVPETMMITQSNALWADQQGNPIYERACQFTSEFANVMLYHYCNWNGMGVPGDPSTQPSRVGCGTAVDTNGITWRVVKLGE